MTQETLVGYCWFGDLIHPPPWQRFPLSGTIIRWQPQCNSSQLGFNNAWNTVRNENVLENILKRSWDISFKYFFTMLGFLCSKIEKSYVDNEEVALVM